MEEGDNASLLIANDLLNILDSLAMEVKEDLAKRLGIEESSIMISATHTRAIEKKVTLPLAELEETARGLLENQEKYVSELKAGNADAETILRNEAFLNYCEKNLRMIREMPLEKTVEKNITSDDRKRGFSRDPG